MENGKFILTSYYTLGTSYVEVAHKYLMPSIQNLGLHADIRGVDSLGSWQKNTSYKPEFLRKMLDLHKEDIVFLDSDAELLQYPSLFNEIPEGYCIAAHILDKSAWYGHTYPNNGHELLSGTLWIRNCDESRKLLDVWIESCQTTNMWEQRVLQMVLEQLEIEPYQLPLHYCYIKTLPGNRPPLVKVDNPVIVHNQVSRVLRHKIG